MGRASLGWAFVGIAVLIAGCAPFATRDDRAPSTQWSVPLAVAPGIGPVAVQAPPLPTPAPRAETASRAITGPARSFPYVPQPEWIPTPVNHDRGRDGAPLDYLVIHYTDISYERTLAEFYKPYFPGVSAHYVVRRDGHVAQLVGESDTAWHAGNYWYNQRSVGIEIELDKITNPAFTAEQYYAVAGLACQISARHGLPLDRVHVVGHNEIPGSSHTDPGPTWSWPHFMWLTSLCAPPTPATVRASWVSQTPYPDIALGDTAAVSVVLRNVGATAWRKGTPQEAQLAVRGNDPGFAFLAGDWPTTDRVAIQSEAMVAPGDVGTFTFTLKGSRLGTFVLPLRGVVDGAAWMDDLGIYVDVVVQPSRAARSLLAS